MPDQRIPTGAEAAGRLLRSLLLDRPDNRQLWQRHQQRRSASGPLCKRAVAQVVVSYLIDASLLSESVEDPCRKLKDRIGRALDGTVFSPGTINLFVGAFQMSPEDERALREALSGPSPGLRAPQPLPIRQRHRTLMLFERRVLDAGGRAAAHHSTKIIRAHEDGVDSYPCFLSPRTAGVETDHEVHLEPPLMRILLPTPLQAGEDTVLDYRRTFLPAEESDTEYRRVFHARAESISIVVQFHAERLPRQVWWATWDHYRAGAVLTEEPAVLDGLHRVHRYVPVLESSAAGFRWAW